MVNHHILPRILTAFVGRCLVEATRYDAKIIAITEPADMDAITMSATLELDFRLLATLPRTLGLLVN